MHGGLFLGGGGGVFLGGNRFVVPFDEHSCIQLQRDILLGAVEGDFHLVFAAVFALHGDRNCVIADRKHLHIFGNVARFADQRGNVCTVDDDG